MFTASERETIGFLFSSLGWVDTYQLHIEFSLSPAQVADIVDRLAAAGYAEIDKDRPSLVRLTSEGRAWVLGARKDVFMRTSAPDPLRELVAPTVKIGEPYLPNLQLLDVEFFKQFGLPRAD